jgi:predicted RNase H-like nuclease
MHVLGIDGWSKGWIGVELEHGHFAKAHVSPTLHALIAKATGVSVVAVDMPLGLLEKGLRRADIESPRLLGRRRSSVFATPPRPVFAEETYRAAAAVCVELTGKGLSQQSFALRKRLLEANSLYDEDVLPLREVHPEVSFTMMARGHEPPVMSKKTWAGQRDRLERLQAVGIVLPDDIRAAGEAAPDDVLDAAAAAWSADRIAHGTAASVPDPPETNDRGQQVAIWY